MPALYISKNCIFVDTLKFGKAWKKHRLISLQIWISLDILESYEVDYYEIISSAEEVALNLCVYENDLLQKLHFMCDCVVCL